MGDRYIGKRIGNYRITEPIASGGFGHVYKATHTIIKQRTVAIKFLRTHLRTEREQERFVMEAELLEMLQHPHILRIYDTGIDDDNVPYIITEFAVQGSLREYLKHYHHMPLPLTKAQAIIVQVGQALQHAHQNNVIHRDLKPENILFNAQGDAVLADFGIATILESDIANRIIGTPRYMAPEQFDGIADAKSDLYALACIAYELFTGHRPFALPSDAGFFAWKHAHQTEQPRPMEKFNPQLPSYIEQTLLTALSKGRSSRYKDIMWFVANLAETKERWGQEGDKFFIAKQFDKALDAYEHALQLDATYATALNGKGAVFRELGRYEEALAAIEQAIESNPDLALAYYNKGITLQRRGFTYFQAAFDAYKQCKKRMPNFAHVYSQMGFVLIILGRKEEAVDCYKEAIRLGLINPDTYHNLGILLKDLQRFDESLDALNTAIRLRPDDANFYNSKGVLLNDMKRHEEALITLDKAIELDSCFIHPYNNKSNALRALRRSDEAIRANDCAIQLKPEEQQSYYLKGLALLNIKRYEEAIEAFQQSIDRKADNTYSHRSKGEALYALARYEEALSAFEYAALLDSKNADAYIGKCKALWKLKRLEEALAAIDIALQIAPRAYVVHSWRGAVLYGLKRYEEALAEREEAISTGSQESIDFRGKGQALWQLERYDEALTACDEAIQLEPIFVRTYWDRGLILEKLGRIDEAQQAFDRAKSLGYKEATSS